MPNPVHLKLEGLNGNTFSLMAAFANQARKEGWTKEDIDTFFKECSSVDYNHLLATLLDNCVDP